ncbi:MAG: hypothetical protein ACR5KV_01960 [Wolbachia sp.]
MLYGDKENLRNHREKCCLILGELIINGAIPQNAEESKEVLEIFKQTEVFDELKEVVKLKFKPQKPAKISKYKPNIILYFQKSPFTLKYITLKLLIH